MSKFFLRHEWSSYADSSPEVGETTARLSIFLDEICLTKNHDIFSKTVRDHILVSLYPLAMWLASSWWRLHYEVLPDSSRGAPSHDWRMSHEMAAANMGFMWPGILICPDNENIQIWARASQDRKEEAVRFLNGLDHVHFVSRAQFENEAASLINDVIARLHEIGCKDSDLSAIWSFIAEDSRDPVEHKRRRLEAVLGFDPEGCPETMISEAIDLEQMIGRDAFSELSGAYAQSSEARLLEMQRLVKAQGVEGKPNDILNLNLSGAALQPWEIAVSAARALRKKIGNIKGAVENSVLTELLGLPIASQVERQTESGSKAAIAEPIGSGRMKFVRRRTHPVAQRFELARFVGDYLRTAACGSENWLVSADLSTARQRFQRAFAAEFLCPIDSLVEYVNGDFSESALEGAANYFSVSERTVDSLLMNNGFLPRSANRSMPYSMA